MFETFRVRNILSPDRKRLCLSILCWVMYEVGFVLLLLPLFDVGTESGMFWYQIANFCAAFLLTVICFMPFLKESLRYTNFKRLTVQVLIGYAMYFVVNYVISFGIYMLKLAHREPTVNVNQDAVMAMLNYKPTVMVICTGLLVPVTEECLVRGVIFAPLCRKNPWPAYVLSSLLFAGLHMIASIGSMSWINAMENLLTYLPSGVVLGWMYQRTGTIIGPIALHCTINLISVTLSLLLV